MGITKLWNRTQRGEILLSFRLAKVLFSSGALNLFLLSFPLPHECLLLLFPAPLPFLVLSGPTDCKDCNSSLILVYSYFQAIWNRSIRILPLCRRVVPLLESPRHGSFPAWS